MEGLRKKELKKHIATIQCAHTFSLLQRKISNALLFHAYQNLLKVEEHQISVKKLCDFINYQGHNYDAIKTALKKLIATVVEWNLLDELTLEEDWTASSILASVRIKKAICYYAYSPRMREYLYSPKIYAKINLIVQAKFKSSYGLALYENCIRYRGIPQTKWFDFGSFKKLMGVSPSHYPVFRDFKRRVLDKAVEEVNTYSDLFIEYEIERPGRKVMRIRFILTVREKKKFFLLDKYTPAKKEGQGREIMDPLIEKLTQQFFIGLEKAQSLIDLYGQGYVKEKINLLESSMSYKNGKVDNLSGYLIEALKNDYKKFPSKAENLPMQKEIKNNAFMKPGYRDYLKKTLEKFVLNFNEIDKKNLFDQFKKYIQRNNPLILEYNLKINQGMFDPYHPETLELIVQGLVKDYVKLSRVFMSFEEYCSSLVNS